MESLKEKEHPKGCNCILCWDKAIASIRIRSEDKQEKEREFIKLDNKEMNLLKSALDVKENICHYCKKKIKRDDKFSIFNKPTRLICDSLLCLTEAMEDDEKPKEAVK